MFGNVETTKLSHPILLGGALGLLWGVGMRIWMRFISSDPEFSWSGTGFILGAATLAGLALGIAGWRRQQARGNGWRLSALALLPLGGGAGAVMLPSVLLGAMALGRRTWPRVVRAILVLVAIGIQVWAFSAGPGDPLPARKVIPAFVAYAIFITLEAKAFSIPFLPSRTADPAADTPALQLANGGD